MLGGIDAPGTGRPTWTYSNGDLSIRVHDVHRVTTCRPGRRHIVAAARLQLVLLSYGCCSSLKYYKFTTTTDHLTVLRMYVNHETAAVPPQTPLQELTAPPQTPVAGGEWGWLVPPQELHLPSPLLKAPWISMFGPQCPTSPHFLTPCSFIVQEICPAIVYFILTVSVCSFTSINRVIIQRR